MPSLHYFDTLPLHPKPLPLESISSWLMRVSAINQLESSNVLHRLGGANMQNLRRQPDTIPPKLKGLAKLTACDKNTILATTFFFLGKKFGRNLDNRIGVLLKSDVAFHLRYCPLCLQDETPYYKLTWRFTDVLGCSEHHVRLVDHCPECGKQNLLFNAQHQVGICHYCDAELKQADTESLEGEEREQNAHLTRELAFLLSLTNWDMDTVARLVGAYWAAERKRKRISAKSFAAQIGISREKLKSIENPANKNKRGVRFQDYRSYLEMLDMTFEDSFRHIVHLLTENPDMAAWTLNEFYEDALLADLKQAHARLEAQGEVVNQKKIAAAIGYSVPTLRHYPRLATYLKPLADDVCLAQQREERIAEQMRQVKAAVKQLQDAGETVTHKAVGEILDRAPEGFDESVKVYLRGVIGSKQERFNAREAELLEAVLEAIDALKAAGKPVTQNAVARRVGVTSDGLKLYPAIAVIMEEIADNHQTYVDNLPAKRIAKLEQAEQTLLDQNRMITLDTLAAEIGIATVSLNHYPEVKAKAKEITKRNKQHNKAIEYREKETRIIHEIHQAEADLQAQEEAVTRQAIIERLCISKRTVSRYEHAREILKDVVTRNSP